MAQNLIEMVKTKIEEARAKLKENADKRFNENLKQEIEKHIAEMADFLKEMEAKGENATDLYLAKATESIEKLEKMLQKKE